MGMREIEAGNAVVRVGVDRSGLEKGMASVKRTLQGTSKMIGQVGAVMAGAGGAIAAAFVPAINAASDFNESFSKFETVFGGNSVAVKKWSDQFANDVGRSKSQIVDFMANSQDLFVPLGFDEESATDLSKTITGLAVDLASFNNKSDDDTLNDLHAALTGSGEVMKKYGVIVSEAAVKQELLNQSIDPSIATDQEKVQARLNLIMRGTTAAQGDAVKTAGSFANQMKRLRSTATDVAVAIGQAVLPTVTSVVSVANKAALAVAGWAEENKEIVGTIFKVAAVVSGVGFALLGLASIVAVVGAAITGLTTVISVVGSVAALVFSPIGIVIAGLTTIVAALAATIGVAAYRSGLLGDIWEVLKSVAMEAWATMTQAFQGIADAIAAGDMALAAQIAMAGVKKVWWDGLTAVVMAVNKSADKMLITLIRFFVQWVKLAKQAAMKVAKIILNPMKAFTVKFDFSMINADTSKGVAEWAKDQADAATKEFDDLVAKAADARNTMDVIDDTSNPAGQSDDPTSVDATMTQGDRGVDRTARPMMADTGPETFGAGVPDIQSLLNGGASKEMLAMASRLMAGRELKPVAPQGDTITNSSTTTIERTEIAAANEQPVMVLPTAVVKEDSTAKPIVAAIEAVADDRAVERETVIESVDDGRTIEHQPLPDSKAQPTSPPTATAEVVTVNPEVAEPAAVNPEVVTRPEFIERTVENNSTVSESIERSTERQVPAAADSATETTTASPETKPPGEPLVDGEVERTTESGDRIADLKTPIQKLIDALEKISDREVAGELTPSEAAASRASAYDQFAASQQPAKQADDIPLNNPVDSITSSETPRLGLATYGSREALETINRTRDAQTPDADKREAVLERVRDTPPAAIVGQQQTNGDRAIANGEAAQNAKNGLGKIEKAMQETASATKHFPEILNKIERHASRIGSSEGDPL